LTEGERQWKILQCLARGFRGVSTVGFDRRQSDSKRKRKKRSSEKKVIGEKEKEKERFVKVMGAAKPVTRRTKREAVVS
jgi:hypothetical protein